MKKRKTWLVLTAVLIILVLAVCGCGKKKEDATPATTETKQASKDETKAETKEEKPEEKTEEATDAPDDGNDGGKAAAQRMQVTMTLLGKLQKVTKVGAGAVQKDADVVYTDSETGFGYNLVTDPDVQSFYDIYQMLYTTFTEGCIDARWKYMVSPDPGTAPYFIFVQDDNLPTGIYIIQAGTGYMDYTPTGDIEIETVDDRHFTATVPFKAYEHTMYLTMDIILEDDWRINGFSVSE